MHKNLERDLKQARVLEVQKDVWMIEGYISDSFAHKTPSSNIYLLRDKYDIYLLDTGFHPFFRKPMLDVIGRFKRDGAKRLTLLLTQGHFDHAFNNDVILETGLPWRFFLPEPEVARTSDFAADFLHDLEELAGYEDIFSTMFPWRFPTGIVRATGKVSPSLAFRMLERASGHLMGGAKTLADQATVLRLADRVSRRFGPVELAGWDLGPFFLIHDASHTQGHICLLDPDRKLLLAGDVTIEINPAFFYSSTRLCQEAAGSFRQLAEAGFVETVGDSHRTSIFFPRLLEKGGIAPLSPLQTRDIFRGREECAAFFGLFEDYYRRLQEQVRLAHRRLGRAEIGDIVEELSASKDPAMRFKAAMRFPDFPSRLDVLAAGVLRDDGVRPVKEGDRIVFDAP